MTAKTNNYQRTFFDNLSKKFSKKADMISAVSDLLHVGRDAVYRRLRGDTVLSADEMIHLARHFDISLDLQKRDEIPRMYYPEGKVTMTSEVDFYRRLLERSEMVLLLDDVKIDYASPELPIFYELYSPTLLAYKTYVYGITAWNFDKWKGKKFDPKLIDPQVYAMADRLLEILYSMPAREMWSIGILDITLREIEHGVSVGYLNDKQLIDTIFEELDEIVNHMEVMARAGKRIPFKGEYQDDQPDFRVYHNEMTNTNNVIIIKSPVQSIVYTTFVNPNFLFSDDARVLHQIQAWFDNLIDSSNVMNADSAKYINIYFNKLHKKIEDTKLRVKVLSSLM